MFKVFATPGGFAVAYVRPDTTKATVYLETHCRESAQAEADKLNEWMRRQQAAQQLREIANRDTWGQRRPVRFFEPDAFA